MKVTLKVIAEKTGVSQMTVSRILRGQSGGQVSDNVRKRVAASLIAHGYDFQRPVKKRKGAQVLPERKIVCIIPREDFITEPPAGHNLDFHHTLEEYCRQNSITCEYCVGLYDNNPILPAWENLNRIPEGTPVLCHTFYEMIPAVALQQRGYRVAVILRDLFWRNFYAPQLKKMSCFSIRIADGISQTIRALRLSGCQKIACCGINQFLAEPGYPVLAGYDYERRISNASYRHVISLGHYNADAECCYSAIHEAYEKNPFDGLFVPSQVMERLCTNFRRKAGLPENVKLASSNISEGAADASRVDFTIRFSYSEIMPHVFRNLFSRKYKPVEESYNCRILNVKKERYRRS